MTPFYANTAVAESYKPQVVDFQSLVVQQGMKLRDIERLVIIETLRGERYNRTRAARVLGIGIRTLQRKIKEYRAEEPNLVLSLES